jgi:Concanavalin A-like lectin/glucanases superfamily
MAVLKRGSDAVWTNGEDYGTGELLPAGWLRLQSGSVQLEFLRGAQVILTGPAEMRIDGENAAFLKSGKVSAEVPEAAHGFSLRAPGMEVVDLGTAFGLDVPATGGPEVHVFTGEVTVAKDGSSQTPQRLQERHAKRLEGGDFHDIPSRPDAFPGQRDLAQREVVEAGERRRAWGVAMERMAQDPDALVVFTCEEEPLWSRNLKNQVRRPHPQSHGALVGAGWTGGRWPGKHGLEFRSQGDRLRFSVPGDYPAVTCITSVRVDSLPNPYNSLLMPSRYDAGAFHWTLERGGELRLAAVNSASQGPRHHSWERPVSAAAISDMDFGRWIILATTYDSSTGDVCHYRDGALVGTGKFGRHPPVKLSTVEFGNWGARRDQPENQWLVHQPKEWDTRNFVGRMDELVILQRALSAAEISAHFQIGRP